MADSTEGSSADPQVTFKVKTSGDKQHTLTMSESATVADLKAKLAGADLENIPPERQRLIYSGRVMKNEEPLSTYKIKAGNTVHMVKSAASNPPPAASSAPSQAVPQVPTNMAAGTANNPLADLTGARYAGLASLPSADLFGPDGGMVGSMMDDEQLANMLNNPQVAQQMNELMGNDQFLDMILRSNPMLRNNPGARDMVRSPLFRQMMTNPDALRSAARLQRMMRDNTGQGSFPMPGVTDSTPAAGTNDATNNNPAASPPSFDPLALYMSALSSQMGSLGGFFSPFGIPASAGAGAGQPAATAGSTPAASTGAQTADNTNTTGGATAGAGQTPAHNPFADFLNLGGNPNAANSPFGLPPMTPDVQQRLVQLMGTEGSGAASAPQDNRPLEERYAEQLRQLNDMGFFDFNRNIEALRRSGGSVQGAIEYLLNQ
ncbi:hypothetical protein GGR50DRAFT_671946 [Xylaria sp. CBS 124048]|nr:hypothetical protein GGR50DRAFT_671946 [Xylaria sp. CBS 124048]